MNSLKLNLILIIEENEIISKLHNPVTEEDCLNLYNTFKNSTHLNQLLDRIKIMAERKEELLNVGKRIKQIRLIHKLTQEEFGQIIGKSTARPISRFTT